MRWFRQSSDNSVFDWKILTSQDQFLVLLDGQGPLAIFKHSTRCSTSSMAKDRVERDWNNNIPVYFLDVLKHRDVSNLIASRLGIMHQTPQFIVLNKGEVVYNASHNGIAPAAAMKALEVRERA